MTVRQVLAVVLAAGCLSACVTAQTTSSRDEFMSLTTHTYTNRTVDDVIKAAELVLRQPAHSSLRVAHFLDGFVADRPYVIYAVLAAEVGTDTWRFRIAEAATGQAKNAPKTVTATVQLSRVRSTTSASAFSVGDRTVVVPMTTTGAVRAAESPSTYQAFWARVDYVLGLRPDWLSCKDAKEAKGARDEGGPSLYGLCPILGSEQAPPPPLSG